MSATANTKPLFDSTRLSDRDLRAALHDTVGRSNQALAQLLDHLAEWDARKLYLEHPCSSLFVYCRDVLHFSEDEAGRRIRVARAARKFPQLLELVSSGTLHLTGAFLLAPHLTPENAEHVLRRAKRKTKRQVEELVAELAPKPDVKPGVRKLPEPRAPNAAPAQPEVPAPMVAGGETAADAPAATATPTQTPTPTPAPAPARVPPTSRNEVVPLAPARYKVQFTASSEYVAMLREAESLLGHAVPDRDIAEIHARAMNVFVQQLRKSKYAATSRPAKRTRAKSGNPRYISAAVKRAVWERDEGRCSYVGPDGTRCNETARLEYHHVCPVPLGGSPCLDNVTLRCRAHNRYEAEKELGREVVEAKIRDRRKKSTHAAAPEGTAVRRSKRRRSQATGAHERRDGGARAPPRRSG